MKDGFKFIKQGQRYKVDWVFKFDCDEFVGEDFKKQLNYVLNQMTMIVYWRKVSKT